ncbi:MAG TPA: hypothetical protein VEL07_21315 [Planctomycetota bacterium]|nr:hypothetical protein [Planctomycetota bacterium]
MAGSDDIDALLNQLKGPPPKAPETPPQVVSNNEVDALLAQLKDNLGKPKAGVPTTPLQATSSPSIAHVEDLAAKAAANEPTTGPSPAASAATAPIKRPVASDGQQLSDIDAILAQLGSRTGMKPVGSVSATAHDAQKTGGGALTGREDGSKPSAGTSASREDSDAHPLLPSDAGASDPLEAVLQGMPMSQVHTTKQIKRGASAHLGLSQEDIDALIAKHGDAGGGEAETMISQDDIDSLVKQLSAATSKLASAAARSATSSFARSVAANASTVMDMPAPAAAGGAMPSIGTTSLTDVRRAVVQSLPPVMMPRELRATRWLLGAAVVLLAVCAATTAGMAMTIGKLGAELRAAHVKPEATHPEDFAVELKAGMTLLGGDDVEAVRGVALLDRLKAVTPSREDEVDLVIARHFRARGAHRQAAERYAAVFERSPRLPSDPAVHLEFAESLCDLGDIDQALRRCYVLLANEQEFRAARDAGGRDRGEHELAMAGEAFARAQLLLGRLHGQRLSQPAAAHGPVAVDAHAPAHAPAHSSSPAGHHP